MTSGLPFDDIRNLIQQMGRGDEAAAEKTRTRLRRSAPMVDEADQLGNMAVWLSRWSGKPPAIRKPLVAIFAGSHGVGNLDIARRPSEDTAAKIEASAAGGLALNQVCAVNDLGLQVYDLAIDLPTADMTVDAALDEQSCAATMAFGMEAVAGGVDLLCLGSFGVGDDLVAASILAALGGGTAREWLPSEPDRVLLDRQLSVVARALAHHSSHLKNPLEILRRLGGRQFAAIAGAIIAARSQNVPVILDGAASVAAAAILKALRSDAVDHCLLAQIPPGEGFRQTASTLFPLPAVFATTISSDEGVAAALAAGVLKSAASLAAAPVRLSGVSRT